MYISNNQYPLNKGAQALVSKQPLTNQAGQGQFGNSLGMKVVEGVMTPINNSRLLELFLADFMGMTFPRTVIETKKRGLDTGRETLFREIVGGLTPVYVCGWVGQLFILGLEKQPFNPKKMSFRSWIDTNMLDHLAHISEQSLNKVNTVKELKHDIVDTVLKQIESSDSIDRLSPFKEYFPEQGKLAPNLRENLLNQLLHKRVKGHKAGQFMNKPQHQTELRFFERLAQKAVNTGGLTHQAVLMHNDGYPYMNVGPRDLKEIFAKTRYFMDEFLSRALSKAGLSSNSVLTTSNRYRLSKALFHNEHSGWFSKHLKPSLADGVIPYMYKLKRTLIATPLLATAIFAFSFARINNWLTSQKFHGRVFFPGEGIPKDLKHLEGVHV